MKNIYIFFTLLLIFLSLNSCTKPDKTKISDFGFKIENINNFTIDKKQIRNGSKKSFLMLKMHNENYHLVVEATSPIKKSKSENLISNKLKITKSLYNPKPTPYKGQFTDVVLCPEEGLPLVKKINFLGEKVKIIVAGATEKHILGACISEVIKSIAFISAVYLKNEKTLLYISAFKKISLTKPKKRIPYYNKTQIDSVTSEVLDSFKLN